MNIKLEINSFDHEGRGIGKYNNKVVFVPNAIPGEIVEIEIIKDKKTFSEGKIISYIKKSPKRIEASCPFYNKCGGCSFEHISIDDEKKVKTNNVINIIKKYANLDVLPIFIDSDKEYNYRNKIELKIENGNWGYYNSLSHNFVRINKCLIAKDSINRIIENKNYFDIKNGSIIIRCNYIDEIIIKIDTSDKYNIDIDNLIKNNKIVGIIVNNKLIYGEDYYIEKVGKYLFKVNINSFFQINLNILSKVFDLISKDKYKTVVDLYCGVGTLGIPINKDKLYGIEIVPEAITDAIKNSEINKQNNLYILGDSSKISKIEDKIDCIIVDPPRSGLNNKTINNILKFNSKSIIYMSCNPMTLARDLNILKEKYLVKKIYILNMFPKTKHVECVCFLEFNNR